MTVGSRVVSKGVLCLACSASACFPQTETTARIAGRVCDVTGAVIVKAEIVARNDVTGEKRSTATNQSGEYVLTSLRPGAYVVTISAPGFSPAKYSNVQTEIGRTVELRSVLKVANAASEITVSEPPPLVPENAEIATPIDSRTLSAMPLPTRNFLQLAALAPGVSMPLTDNSAVGRNSPNFSVNGARTSQNNLQINGIDANDITAHDLAAVAIPAPESISNVVVKTSMYDASVPGAGASVQLVTQSGTDFLHGSIYDYFRGSGLNANDPNLKAVGLGRPVLDRTVFGATFGGPIRKDRAFFFVSYQGTRETNGATADQSVYKSVLIAPVPEGANGLTDDRSEAALLAGFQPILPPGTTSIDATALALLNAKLQDGRFVIPTPQQDGRGTGTAPSTYQEEQFNTNLDLSFTTRDSVAARFFFADAPEFWALGGGVFSVGSSVPGFGTRRQVNNRVVSIQDIHTFNPAAVNETRVGYNIIGTSEIPEESVRDSDIGISRPTAGTFPGLPLILLARDSGGAAVGSSSVTIHSDSPSMSLVDVVSVQKGTHNVRLGGEFRRYQWNGRANLNAYGEIDFPTFDQFLLGKSDFSSIGVGLSDRNFRANDYNFFVQDDWKLTSRLTLNLGLRYELDLPPHDTHGRIGGFDPSFYAPRMEVDADGFPIGPPSGGIVMAGNAIPQYELPGVPRVSNSVLKSIDPNNFGPHVGFTWSPRNSDRIAVRGGYGIFYHRPNHHQGQIQQIGYAQEAERLSRPAEEQPQNASHPQRRHQRT